jgi:hypothetical protein
VLLETQADEHRAEQRLSCQLDRNIDAAILERHAQTLELFSFIRPPPASIAATGGANDIRKKIPAGLLDLIDHRQRLPSR